MHVDDVGRYPLPGAIDDGSSRRWIDRLRRLHNLAIRKENRSVLYSTAARIRAAAIFPASASASARGAERSRRWMKFIRPLRISAPLQATASRDRSFFMDPLSEDGAAGFSLEAQARKKNPSKALPLRHGGQV
jgi:hypothetical protein